MEKFCSVRNSRHTSSSYGSVYVVDSATALWEMVRFLRCLGYDWISCNHQSSRYQSDKNNLISKATALRNDSENFCFSDFKNRPGNYIAILYSFVGRG